MSKNNLKSTREAKVTVVKERVNMVNPSVSTSVRRKGRGWFLVGGLLMLTQAARCAPATPDNAPQVAVLRGDGVADDTAALQNALDTQKSVVLGPGSYRITQPLRLTSGTTIIGPGKLIVDFDSGKMDSSNAALYGHGQDIRIEGISILKRFIDGSYGTGVLIDKGSQNIVVRNVEISGYSARYGIHIVESENFEITGCYIHDFMMDAGADMILDSPAGARVTRCKNGVISNNRILRIEVGAKGYASVSPLRPAYGRQGYQSDCFTIQECQAISLVGNVLDTTGEAIDLLLSQDCAVSGNNIHNIWFQGIKLLGVRYTSVTGNTLRNCLEGIGLAEHVVQKTDCVGNTVTGNTILDSGATGTFRVSSDLQKQLAGAYGIDMSRRCLNNIVAYNTILDTQPQKSMKRPINNKEKLPNIIEGNNTGADTAQAPGQKQ